MQGSNQSEAGSTPLAHCGPSFWHCAFIWDLAFVRSTCVRLLSYPLSFHENSTPIPADEVQWEDRNASRDLLWMASNVRCSRRGSLPIQTGYTYSRRRYLVCGVIVRIMSEHTGLTSCANYPIWTYYLGKHIVE